MRGLCVLLSIAFVSGAFAQVTSNSILQETADLSRLTKRPDPYYTTAEATSYDRATKTPGNPDWFANGDAGQFIREEQRDGRTERVMADLTGPGAVVRIWSANPGGTLRFYFDGETEPRFVAKTADLLGGHTAPFADPFAYESAKGWNFYYPLPYAKSLKITVDNSDGDQARNLYYHVGYRTYQAGTQVDTFQPSAVDTAQLEQVGKQLSNPYTPGYRPDYHDLKLRAGGSAIFKLPNGPRAVTYFYAKLIPAALPKNATFDDPNQIYNQLRQIVLEAEFDGETCIRVPLGDFFGAAPGTNAYQTFPIQVDADGGMACRFVMPYAKTGTIRLINMGTVRAGVTLAAETVRYAWDATSYHFKAQWNGEHARTRPMRDMTFLKTTGEGVFVGDNMLVSNPVPAWWGEGDEKIYVDGEKFPSSIGTGTEDYYGYAWGDPNYFTRPFHAQPHTEPANFGHSLVERFHIMDCVHYSHDFRFDMEMWHWADVTATFVHTAYWYAKPGGPGPVNIDPKLLVIYELKPPAPVKDAIEGESLKVVSKTGGETEIQTGFWDTSGGSQLWWRNGAPGDKLDLIVPVKKAGRYKVVGHFCFAKDYGIQKMSMNGQAGKQADFYSTKLEWKMVEIGTFDLTAGDNHLVVEVAGTNPAADPKGYMWGLDYLKLERP
jgi:hypothetical protein